MILSHLLSEGCGHQSVLRFQLSDLLLTDRNPLELVTAQANCGEAYTEQKTNGQPQSFHVVITILSIFIVSFTSSGPYSDPALVLNSPVALDPR